jgi:tetratricopeptide (TPR) repeat protein
LSRLGRRLDLIAASARDLPERRQTLRGAIQWSYDLLDAETQRVFRTLGVFSPGGSLDAAAAVAVLDEIAAADALQTLAAHHLVSSPESADGEPCFEMSETMRHFALEALEAAGERVEARRRHAAWYLALAEQGGPKLTGKRQLDWLDRLEGSHANFATAIDWAIEQRDASTGLRFAANLWRVWLARARVREGWTWFERTLSLPRDSVDKAVTARALHGYAILAQNLGKNYIAKQALEEGLGIWRELGDKAGLAQALTSRSWVSCELCELEDADLLAAEALALHEQSGDQRGAALAWNNRAWAASYRAEYTTAKAAIEQSLSLRRAGGDRRGEGFALACLAWIEQWHGDAKTAHRLLDEASRILLPVADPILLGWTLTVRALTLLDQGRLEEACEIIEKARREWERGANLSGEAWVRGVLGAVLLLRGRLREADDELERAVRIWREIGSGWGVAMSLGERARVLARRGRVAEAKRALAESLALRRAMGDRRGVAHCLETAAELAGDSKLSGRLLGSAARLRDQIGAPAATPDEQYRRDAGLRPAGEISLHEALTEAALLVGG